MVPQVQSPGQLQVVPRASRGSLPHSRPASSLDPGARNPGHECHSGCENTLPGVRAPLWRLLGHSGGSTSWGHVQGMACGGWAAQATAEASFVFFFIETKLSIKTVEQLWDAQGVPARSRPSPVGNSDPLVPGFVLVPRLSWDLTGRTHHSHPRSSSPSWQWQRCLGADGGDSAGWEALAGILQSVPSLGLGSLIISLHGPQAVARGGCHGGGNGYSPPHCIEDTGTGGDAGLGTVSISVSAALLFLSSLSRLGGGQAPCSMAMQHTEFSCADMRPSSSSPSAHSGPPSLQSGLTDQVPWLTPG